MSCLASSRAADKPQPPRPVREIYVPFDQLDVLLEGPTRRVLMSREEFDGLLKKARRSPTDAVPQEALLLAADYDLKIDNLRAEITARLTCEVLGEGLHALSLDLADVGIREAKLDGRAAPLGRAADGRPTLFVSGRGRHEATLSLVTPLETGAAQQTLNLRLPRLPASRLKVTAPGNVEVRSGASVIRRETDEGAGVTRLELVPVDGQLSLALSLNNRRRSQQKVVVARSVLVDEVTTAYERLHATVSLSILHQAVDRFRFALPEGFEVADVQSPALARWSTTTDAGRKVLEVALRQETTDAVVLKIAAVRSPARLDDWTFPNLEPLDVAGRMSVVGLLLEDRLQAQDIATDGLLPIDVTVLSAALPESVFEAEPGAPRVRSIASYYAADGEVDLTARFVRPESRLRVTSNFLLTLRDQGLEVRGGFALSPEAEALHEFDFGVPAGWQVTSVTAADGSRLTFERYDEADGAGRIHVRLPTKIAVGSPQSVFFTATRTPTGWLDEWTKQSVEFPKFAVVGTATDVGAVAVAAEDDLTVRPDVLTNLTPLADAEKPKYGLANVTVQSAYRYDATEYRALLTVERTTPRVTARTFSFFRVEPDVLTAHYELIYDVARARARRLSFTLPASTPAAVSIRLLDGKALKEYTSADVEGGRRWTVLLAEAAQGRLRLAVDFQQPLSDDEVNDYGLPIVRAFDTAYQSGIVAVEGSAEIDVQVVKHPRKVDVGELVDADYQTGRRLLGAFGFVGDDAEVTINVVRHPQYGLQPALVQHAEYVTLLGVNGRAQTSASLGLRTKAGFLEVKLPAGSTLWSAVLDGRPAQPQREGDSLLLSFPSAAGDALRSLTVVYETPIARLAPLGRVEIPALSLFLRPAGGAAATEVPVADVRWMLHLPPGYEVLRSRGSVTSVGEARAPQLAATQVAEFLVAGGFGGGWASGQFRRSARIASEELAQGEGDRGDSLRFHGDGFDDDLDHRPNRMKSSRGGDELTQKLETKVAPQGTFDGLAGPSATIGMAPPPSVTMPPLPATPAPAAAGEPAAPAKPQSATGTLTFSAGNTLALPSVDRAAVPWNDQTVMFPDNYSTSGKSKFAMAGVRSLTIDLQATDNVEVFHSLGVAPQLDVTLVDRRRAGALAWTLALAVFLYGMWLTRAPARRKLGFVIGVALAATLLPLVTGWFELVEIVNPSFYAACLLLPYYAVAWCVLRCCSWICPRCCVTPAALVVILTVGLAIDTARAAEPPAATTPVVVHGSPLAPPVKVPDDALILLYQPTDAPGAPQAEQLLVPYEQYQELWNRANPDEQIQKRPPPASYAPAGAAFTATLEGDDYLLVNGRLEFDLFVDEYVEIPLALAGGVLAEAKLDKKPARLNIVSPQQAAEAANPFGPQSAQMSKPAAKPAGDPGALLVLVAQGKGRHELELSIRLSLKKSGGWRIAEGRLPAVAAAALTLTIPQAATDVRLENVPDRRQYATTKANETIATALGPNGAVRIQWRPKINAGQIDETLKARSEVMLAVQEDGVRLAWQTSLEFSGASRETFTITVPADYLVERVAGDNVRSWEPREEDGRRKLEVTLLEAAASGVKFTVYLSRRGKLGDEPSELAVPIVGVEGAAVHNGQITLRRSRLLDLRTLESTGLTRADLPPDGQQIAASAEAGDVSPLGMRPFQTYRFAAPSYSLKLAIEPAATKTTAELHTIVRVAERERRLETQLALRVVGPPIYRLRVYLPDDFEPDQVSAGAAEWAVTTDMGRKLLSIYFGAGQVDTVNVVLAGVLGKPGPLTVVPLPRLEVLDVERQQGDLVVQVDPAFNVEATDLRGLDRELLDRTFGWLTAAQRPTARLALRHSSGDYGGNLRLTVRKAVVRCQTVTNVRVTDRTIEETILLDFTIRDAGVREVSFLLPAALKDAKISVPRLREQTIEPVGDDGRQIRVRLQLQDEVMDQLRVLVSNDRARSADVQEAPLPVVETGQTDGRFVALESSGRDEVTAIDKVGLEPLDRRRQQWQVIAGLLGGGSTQAFRVETTATEPRLTYQARTRTAVETVGARIGLAEATLVFDASGAYRAVQSYRMDNKSEQFLTVALPEGAALWTAWVAGEPVKPTRAPPPASSREVRVPLVKTAAGDLDYEVRLVYGGKLADLDSLRRVSFPLVKSVNVKVELSQVRLYLPESYRWFNFGGTMRLVGEDADLQAGSLSYYNKSTEKLAQTLEEGDEFAKVRASNSLNVLKSDVQSYLGAISQYREQGRDNVNLQRELAANTNVWREAEKQQQAQTAQQAVTTNQPIPLVSNSGQLDQAFTAQNNAGTRNVVQGQELNFKTPEYKGTTVVSGGTLTISGANQFDTAWFAGNRLATAGDKKEVADGRVQQGGKDTSGRGAQGFFGSAEYQPAAPQQALNKSGAGSMTPTPQATATPTGARPGEADVVQRYQRRLEEQTKQQQDVSKRLPEQFGVRGTQVPADRSGVRVSAQPMFSTIPQTSTYSGGIGGLGGGLPNNAPTTPGMSAAGVFSADLDVPLPNAAGLVGLDVQIPERGVLYRFTTPLGEPDVSAMPVAAPLVESLERLVAVLVSLLVLWIVWRFIAAGRLAPVYESRLGALVMVALGFFSIVLWILPLVGLLVFTTGIVLLIRRLFVPATARR